MYARACRAEVRPVVRQWFCLHDGASFCSLQVKPSSLWLEKRSHRDRMAGRDNFDLRQRRIREGIQSEQLDQSFADQRQLVSQIAQLGRERRWQEALHLFLTEPQPNPMLHNAAIDACAKSFQQRPAWHIFQAMPKKTVSVYNIMIALQGRMRRVAVAEDLFEEMQKQCLKPTIVTFTSLMTAYGMAHDVESALQTLNHMSKEGIAIDRVAYSVALSACARAGDKERTVQVLACMAAACIQPDMTQLTSIIVSCALSKDEVRARQALQEIRDRGFKPDAIVYTSFITCLSGPDALRKAEAVLAEMRDACAEPDSFAYNALLQLALSSNSAERFQEIVADMESRGISETRETQLLRERAHHTFGEGSSEGHSAVLLPGGWRETVDPSSGRSYYWNESDPAGTTTWVRPS